jgi:hypothetical protein
MFLFGIIAGIILGFGCAIVAAALIMTEIFNLSVRETVQMCELMYDAGHNREATVTLCTNDVLIDMVEFKKK